MNLHGKVGLSIGTIDLKERKKDMETVYGNGMTFKIKQEADGWWSVYEERSTNELIPVIQAKDREHALSHINMLERPRVSFNVL